MSFDETWVMGECDVAAPTSISFGNGGEGFGLALVRSTSMGRKRVFPSMDNTMMVESLDSEESPPLNKKQCSSPSENYTLESLPQEILKAIVCSVDHDDLKSLFHVSKSVREVTLNAKETHFAYKTPKKRHIKMPDPMEDFNNFYEDEQPIGALAPKQSRAPRLRRSEKELASISVALFASDGVNWPRKDH